MRFLAAILLALTCAAAQAERILLIPLDSRPATGQFAQMIGKIAGVDVVMPPYEDLGRFTSPGRPDAILDWLSKQNMSDVTSVIASADMVEYGGLIASRISDTPTDTALKRVRRLVSIVRQHQGVRLYAFSATMRLLPTATEKSSKYRIQLGLYEEQKAKFDLTGDSHSKKEAIKLRPTVPAAVIADYESTRKRNNTVQRELIRMQSNGAFDYLILGQDDARPFGPHVPETVNLRKMVEHLHVERKVFFCEGVDQHACVLLSRALLKEVGWEPRVRVIYSDEAGKDMYASFESKPIKDSLADQLEASGAQLVGIDDPYDYTLYLNTPLRREDSFRDFVNSLEADVDQGLPVAVADIDLAHNGTADPELFSSLWENRRMMRLVSYAGWNTAGNSMGTAIPAANVYLLARRIVNRSPLKREIAQREFLLHRFVDDFAYHRYTRVQAYEHIAEDMNGMQDEIYGQEYSKVNGFVQQDLSHWLDTYFSEQFLHRTFQAGEKEYAFSGLSDVKIWLPWPRAYEVRLEFKLQAKPVEEATLALSKPGK